MRKTLCLVAVALLATELSVTTAWAHGVVGDYVFLEPVITQDPTPANELDILQPSWVKTRDANNYAVGFSVEKVLYLDGNYMPRFSVGGGSNWSHSAPYQGPSLQGSMPGASLRIAEGVRMRDAPNLRS